MAILQFVKPGQIVLAVDLTAAGSISETLHSIEAMGYRPKIRRVSYSEGTHLVAILKAEQPEVMADDYLLDEWQQVSQVISSEAVHLWRGKSKILAI